MRYYIVEGIVCWGYWLHCGNLCLYSGGKQWRKIRGFFQQ